MALFFATGAVCFFVGPFPGYASLVGEAADSVTFFVGSILFTAGGALQTCLSFHVRRAPGAGQTAWLAAIVQSAGTLCFNVTTYRACRRPSPALSTTSSSGDPMRWAQSVS